MNEKNEYQVKMPNVRISFPNLFQTSVFAGEDTGKYDATFILDKEDHKDLIKEIKVKMKGLADEKLKGKMPADDKLCLKDGDETERDEQQGCYVLKASTKKRPMVLDRDRAPVVESDNVIYPGAYVNSIVTLWAQDNAYGKRLNASLDGVMFCEHGEPFGPPPIAADEFDAFEDASDENTPF
jgi:hypothetical protein